MFSEDMAEFEYRQLFYHWPVIVADFLYQLILIDLIRNIQFCVYGIMNAFDINLVYLFIFYMTSLQIVDFFIS